MISAKALGARIQKLRDDQGIGQAQLAAQLIVSRNTVSNIERGAVCPNIWVLDRLARALGTNICALVDDVCPRGGGVVEEVEVEDDLDDTFYDRVNATLVAMKEDK